MKSDKSRKRFVFLCVAPATILFFIFMILPTLNVDVYKRQVEVHRACHHDNICRLHCVQNFAHVIVQGTLAAVVAAVIAGIAGHNLCLLYTSAGGLCAGAVDERKSVVLLAGKFQCMRKAVLHGPHIRKRLSLIHI